MTSSRLLQHITAARWFGGKGRSPRLVAVTPLPWLRSPGDWPAVRCEIAQIAYPDGTTEAYQLLISYRPAAEVADPLTVIDDVDHGPLHGVDGTDDPALHAALVELIIGHTDTDSECDQPSDQPMFTVHRLPHAERLEPGRPSRVFAGEQSNTSVLYGEHGWLKIFRRLEPGHNPDVVIHDQLSRAGNRGVTQLFGWLRVDRLPDHDESADLAMLVEQISDAADGWRLALSAVQTGRSFAHEAEALGEALAAVHADLRRHFGTETIDGSVVAELMTTRLRAAVEVVADLERLQPGLTAIFDRLRSTTIEVQRLHGDFHLGQALLSPAGWKIIDFEGEPAKPYAERLRPDSIWRDLAGALRSFDYAAGQAASTSATAGFVDDDRRANWRATCQAAFLAGYGAAATRQDELRTAYVADKAIYEIVYESRNRPDWVSIPMRAATELAAGTLSAEAQS